MVVKHIKREGDDSPRTIYSMPGGVTLELSSNNLSDLLDMCIVYISAMENTFPEEDAIIRDAMDKSAREFSECGESMGETKMEVFRIAFPREC